MRFSVWPNLGQPWADVLAVATHAEATGWDGVYVADHFMGDGERAGGRSRRCSRRRRRWPRWPRRPGGCASARSCSASPTATRPCWPSGRRRSTTSAAGACCSASAPAGRSTSTSSTASSSARPACASTASRRRCEVLQRAAARHRSRRSTASTTALRDAVAEPKPVQDPLPILIGGKGDRMLGVVARHADEWNMWAQPGARSPSARRPSTRAARRSAATRPTIARSCQALWFVTDDQAKADELIARAAPRPAVGGPVERLVDAVQGVGRRRRRRGHRPRLHARHRRPAPRAPRPHHRGGRPRVPGAVARSVVWRRPDRAVRQTTVVRGGRLGGRRRRRRRGGRGRRRSVVVVGASWSSAPVSSAPRWPAAAARCAGGGGGAGGRSAWRRGRRRRGGGVYSPIACAVAASTTPVAGRPRCALEVGTALRV